MGGTPSRSTQVGESVSPRDLCIAVHNDEFDTYVTLLNNVRKEDIVRITCEKIVPNTGPGIDRLTCQAFLFALDMERTRIVEATLAKIKRFGLENEFHSALTMGSLLEYGMNEKAIATFVKSNPWIGHSSDDFASVGVAGMPSVLSAMVMNKIYPSNTVLLISY